MAYVTPDNLRRFLRRAAAFTAEEWAQAELIIELAEGDVEDETGQSLEESTDTVVLDGPTWAGHANDPPGTGSHKLVLPRWPVTAVDSVTLLHPDADDEVLEFGTDYTWSADGILTRVGGWWPTGDRSVQVVNTAGYATIPKGVRRIVLRIAAAGWENPALLKSESIGDYARAWAANSPAGLVLTETDRRTLGLYRART